VVLNIGAKEKMELPFAKCLARLKLGTRETTEKRAKQAPCRRSGVLVETHGSIFNPLQDFYLKNYLAPTGSQIRCARTFIRESYFCCGMSSHRLEFGRSAMLILVACCSLDRVSTTSHYDWNLHDDKLPSPFLCNFSVSNFF
jgi:hypothetical protein